MGIKKEFNGTFTVSFSKRNPVTGVPLSLRRTGFKSKAEANRAFNKVIIDVEEKIRRKMVPTWSELVSEYLHNCKARDLTNKTVENERLCLNAHTIGKWADRRVDSITTEEIRNLLNDRVGKRSVGQQKSVLRMIRSVFNLALEKGLIGWNPTPKPSFKKLDKIMPVLKKSEVKTLLSKAQEMNHEWYPIWVMALYTGMRNGELYALEWKNVDFESNLILVNSSWNKLNGFKATKSGHDRVVDIAPPLLTLLKKLKMESVDSTFVLPRADRWESGEQARVLQMFMVGIGLPRIRFHDLRATWATLMLSEGVEPVKVMSMGGWKDIKTMMIYIRKAGVDIKGVASCLGDLHSPEKVERKVLFLGGCSDL